MTGIESSRDSFLQGDVERIANSACIPWDELGGSSVLVTGATGLIGSLVVMALACRNRLFNQGIKIKALARNREKAERVFGNLLGRPGFEIVEGDVNTPIEGAGDVDYIIHAASATSSKYFVTNPVETIATAIDGTRNVLELARRCKVKGFLYLSSLEVYGVPAEGRVKMLESEAGYIDSMKVRSCYSEGKRMVECLCASYASEYGVPAKVVRLSQTFGAGVAYTDGRVFAQFSRSAIEGADIVLKTKGETLRNYCYTADAVTALLLVLVKGSVGEAYNVANKDTAISIADMAKFVCDKFSGGRSKVVFDIAEDATKLGYNPVVKICLDTAKLEALGWKAEFGLEEMFRRTIESMKYVYREENPEKA